MRCVSYFSALCPIFAPVIWAAWTSYAPPPLFDSSWGRLEAAYIKKAQRLLHGTGTHPTPSCPPPSSRFPGHAQREKGAHHRCWFETVLPKHLRHPPPPHPFESFALPFFLSFFLKLPPILSKSSRTSELNYPPATTSTSRPSRTVGTTCLSWPRKSSRGTTGLRRTAAPPPSSTSPASSWETPTRTRARTRYV